MPTKHNQTKAAPATQGDTQKTVSIVWAYPTSPDAARFGFKESGCWIVGTQSPGGIAESISGHADEAAAHAAARATGLPYGFYSRPAPTTEPTRNPHVFISPAAHVLCEAFDLTHEGWRAPTPGVSCYPSKLGDTLECTEQEAEDFCEERGIELDTEPLAQCDFDDLCAYCFDLTQQAIERLPKYDGNPEKWADAMHAAGLAYHIDDDPADIQNAQGVPLFTPEECAALRGLCKFGGMPDAHRDRYFSRCVDLTNGHAEALDALATTATACGLNAEWSCRAWSLPSGLFIIDNENDTLSLVQRVSPAELGEAADATEGDKIFSHRTFSFPELAQWLRDGSHTNATPYTQAEHAEFLRTGGEMSYADALTEMDRRAHDWTTVEQRTAATTAPDAYRLTVTKAEAETAGEALRDYLDTTHHEGDRARIKAILCKLAPIIGETA